jgi:hypothetical protein
MKCECCDSTLSDAELTIKSATTGLFLNACIPCLSLMEGIEYTCENDITLELGTDLALIYIDYKEDYIDNNGDVRYNQ